MSSFAIRQIKDCKFSHKLVSKIEESFFNDSYLDHCVVSNTGYLFVTDRNRDCVYVFN